MTAIRTVVGSPIGDLTLVATDERQLGSDVLAKDVGAAVGRNPLCVIVPCHRVVGKDGRLTGYAGGLTRKRFLLQLERQGADTGALF
jgi:methylated-DNA-[protein]-cysteine S-methyltransferase